MQQNSNDSRTMRLKPLVAALGFSLAAAAMFITEVASANSPTPTDAVSARYALRMRIYHADATGTRPAHAQRARKSARVATTLPVTSCADDADPGTLRNVIAGASEGDVIDLTALTCSTITLSQGSIDISLLGAHQLYDLTVNGPGRDALTISGGGASQVFVAGGASSYDGAFSLNDLTIAHGAYNGGLAACILDFGGDLNLTRVTVTDCHASGTVPMVFSGAIDSATLRMTNSTISDSSSMATGTANAAAAGAATSTVAMILNNSTITGNSVGAPVKTRGTYNTVGGGLEARGTLVMRNSTVSGNSVKATNSGEDAPGGGIFVRGIATLSGSTIDHNEADGDGGGVFKAIYSVYGEPGGSNPTTKLTIENTTISGNVAGHGGGGIASSRPLYLYNSTIADNLAQDGGGGVLFRLVDVIDSSGLLEMQSTLVANNQFGAGATFAMDVDADEPVVASGASNLVMAAGNAVTLPANTLSSNPLLQPLSDNGGTTLTQSLGEGSPAIDTGNNAAALEFDQRGVGFTRVYGAAPDIGAFEVQPAATDVIFKNGFDGLPTF